MKLFFRLFSSLTFMLVGVFVGLAVVDSTMQWRTKVNGVYLETLRPDEQAAALLQPNASVSTETIVDLWWMGRFTVQGAWVVWVPLFVFPPLFLILGRRLRKRFSGAR